MHLKFLARGTGSAGAAAAYLLGERDSRGEPREGVEVLRGDPQQVAAAADALGFQHRYTAGVLAWAPEDAPTGKQIARALDEFERTAWAGLDPGRYAWAAVLHRRARRRSACACAGGALRPGDGAQPEHRPAGVAQDVRPAAGRA